MKVKIPYWAEEVKEENWIVLFWFLRSLTICYPIDLIQNQKGRPRGGTNATRKGASYNILPTDFNTIVGTRKGIHRKIDSWPTVAENFSLGMISNENYRCTLKSWYDMKEVELKEQRSKDLVLYLSGCLNHNLVTDLPRTQFQINTALKGHFKWFRDEAEDNGWYTEA
jgi:hypothetical protein